MKFSLVWSSYLAEIHYISLWVFKNFKGKKELNFEKGKLSLTICFYFFPEKIGLKVIFFLF